ncbi:hypothetical protein MTR67_030601 [Solanum verrucosum]|uniref:Uncharacterized protein n=1 Tax=Solanum verrucosum TaxID=315347 RepID=A0AAF0R7X2_SOLVR|nr:hypothetical protein MTR67_030601 [Solanum verrucosum]
MGGSHINYQRQGGNQSWNKDRDGGWKDWRGGNRRDRKIEKDMYMPHHDCPRSKDTTRPKESRTEEMLARIYNKVDESDKVLRELNNDFSLSFH